MTAGAALTTTLAYDDAGNLTQRDIVAGPDKGADIVYVYDDLNRLTAKTVAAA